MNALSEAQTTLLQALRAADAPAVLIDRAIDGVYDDYKSNETAPIMRLVHDAGAFGLKDIAKRAKDGEFDGTKNDSTAWAASAEGQKAIRSCEVAG